MQIITLAAQKGGVGKTTLAVNLAVAAQAAGIKTALFDLDPQESATRLLERALRLGVKDDSEWLHSSAVKTHMRRMDPSFSEKALGHRSFSDFVKAHPDVADIDESTNIVRVRLHTAERARS